MYKDDFLLQKEIDWSTLNNGMTLPIRLNNIFAQTKDGNILNRGESKEIRILLEGSIYNAKITNVNFSKDKRKNPTIQLRYSKYSDLAKKLRTLFNKSYEYHLIKRKKNHSLATTSNHKKEYINIYRTKYFDTYYFEPIFSETTNNSDLIGGNPMSGNIKLVKDIVEYVNDISDNQYKKDRWIRYMIDFHKIWGKQNQSINNNMASKYIWGKMVTIDSNSKISDIFNDSFDKITLNFFKSKNKNRIHEIEENDLIELMFAGNFGFLRFKSIIDKLFQENQDNILSIDNYQDESQGEIKKALDTSVIEENELVFNYMESEDHDLTRGQAMNSFNLMIEELEKLKDFINIYDKEIDKLNSKIYAKDETIANLQDRLNAKDKEVLRLKEEINNRDQEISNLEIEIDTMQETIDENAKALNELEVVKVTLKDIKDLLENSNFL